MSRLFRTTPAPGRPRKRTPRRRAAVLIIMVLILGLTNLLMLSSVAGSSDDARLAATRADTVRSFYAGESGAAMVIGEYSAGRSIPTGTITLPTGQAVDISSSGTGPVNVTIVGRSGQARRQLTLTIQ